MDKRSGKKGEALHKNATRSESTEQSIEKEPQREYELKKTTGNRMSTPEIAFYCQPVQARSNRLIRTRKKEIQSQKQVTLFNQKENLKEP